MPIFSLVVMKYSGSGCVDVKQFHGSQELSRKGASVLHTCRMLKI